MLELGGLAAGLLAALALTRMLAGLLYGVSVADPVTFAAVCGVLVITALAAGFFPAWRAATWSPLTALRAE
jgi:ABC-type lipoprotein release transport system permease subunit